MKGLISCLSIMAFMSGCSTIPSTPDPHTEKYTVQVVEVEVPSGVFTFEGGYPPNIDIESELFAHPDAVLFEYPIVAAGVGESVTNDQTKHVVMAEDYSVVEGKDVAQEKVYKLGSIVSANINELENGYIYCHTYANRQELVGFDETIMENGERVMIPAIKTRELDMRPLLEPNSWIMIGGLTSQRSDGENLDLILCLRVIPPDINE